MMGRMHLESVTSSSAKVSVTPFGGPGVYAQTARPKTPAALALNLCTKIWFVNRKRSSRKADWTGRASKPRDPNCSRRGAEPPRGSRHCCGWLWPLRSPRCGNARGDGVGGPSARHRHRGTQVGDQPSGRLAKARSQKEPRESVGCCRLTAKT